MSTYLVLQRQIEFQHARRLGWKPPLGPALEVLYRVSRGSPRTTAHLLRASLMLAHERDQSFVDETKSTAQREPLHSEFPFSENYQAPTGPGRVDFSARDDARVESQRVTLAFEEIQRQADATLASIPIDGAA